MHNHDKNGPHWYAIRTRSRYEKLVYEQLASRRVEAFLPLVDRRRRWKDRWKMVSFPLFPGYCFAHFPHQHRMSVVTAVGVVQILGVNGHAIPIPEHEIEAVRQLVTCTLPLDPHPYLREGMEVEVLRGPLAGVHGILVRKGRHARLVVAIHLIQQAASVELDAQDVQPVG
jgi:transcription antitermination factor NusG